MHGGIANVFNGYSYIPLPDQYLFVIARGDHFGSVVFYKSDGVDGCQMVVVFLGDFPRGGIVCNNLVIETAYDKNIVSVRIKFDNVWHMLIGV